MTENMTKKYRPLHKYLSREAKKHLKLTLADIERIIDAKLPKGAMSSSFWENNSIESPAWLEACYEVESFDETLRLVQFRLLHRRMSYSQKKMGVFLLVVVSLIFFAWNTQRSSNGVKTSRVADSPQAVVPRNQPISDPNKDYVENLISSEAGSACEISHIKRSYAHQDGGYVFQLERRGAKVPDISLVVGRGKVIDASLGSWVIPFDYDLPTGSNRDVNCATKLFAYIMGQSDSKALRQELSKAPNCGKKRINKYIISCKDGDVVGAGYMSIKYDPFTNL